MPQWLVYGMVYSGAVLMAYNIYCFVSFARDIGKMKAWEKGAYILFLPVVLLALFFLGYLAIGLIGKPDWIVAGILFGGSVFVFVMYRLLDRITQRIIESKQLEAKLAAAEESSRTKSSFLASISHEMRTPLNIILGQDHIALLNPNVPAETRDQLEKIGQSAKHLAGLINSILDLRQIESGGLTLNSEAFSLKEALDQVNALAASLCQEKGLEYRTSFAPSAVREYIGDMMQLKRAILCLLDNAVKYTDAPGTVTFTVTCAEEQGPNTLVCFTVSDTGVGIDPAFMPRLFEPLTQEDASFTNRFGGSGLGLTLAKAIITSMGGEIKAESEKGKGSVFTITLPLAVSARQQKEETPESFAARNVSLQGRRVMIVDDMEENAEIVADLLELEDTESERAQNGQVALDMFRKSEKGYYDAILMDLRMPVMDGLQAVRAIRALNREDAKIVPIIALTANAFDSDVKQSLEAGMNAHLAKPVDADLLYQTLKEWIYASGKQEG